MSINNEPSETLPLLHETIAPPEGVKPKKTKKGHGHGHGHGEKKDKVKSHGHEDHGNHDEHDHDAELGLEHHHHHAPDPVKLAKERRARISLGVATGFTLLFMVGEIVGGYIAGSLAIMTDAAHLLTDVAAMCLSLFAMHLASRPATSRMSYGYARAEILGALFSVILIWALVGVLIYEAILRLNSDVHLTGDVVDGRIMTIIGGCGLAVNIIDALILMWGNAPHGHSHGGGGGHGHSHGGGGNINVRAALIHVIGDCLQSIGVIAAAVVIWVGNEKTTGSPAAKDTYYNLADPIASLLFGVITLFTTFRIIKQILAILMERVPHDVNLEAVRAELCAIEGVVDVHDLHIWSLSQGKNVLTAHISAETPNSYGVLRAAQAVCRNHGIGHSTIEVDPHRQEECHAAH